jgi:hypoxanthine phosphoribosyltransferase
MSKAREEAYRASIELPKNYELVFSPDSIRERIKEVAVDVREWMSMAVDHKREQLLAVCVLRGGVFFFTDLIRELNISVEPVFCKAESYSYDNTQMVGKGVKVDVEDVKPAGRSVLIVDDICDTGLTLLKLHNLFLELGAKSVCSAVLIHREVQVKKYEPSWSAFSYPGAEWFVGYGLDDGNKYRNLPGVHRIIR